MEPYQLYQDFLYACSSGDSRKVAQLLEPHFGISNNTEWCCEGMVQASASGHQDICGMLWRFTYEPHSPLAIECWLTRNKPRAVAYWQLRAPIDRTKQTKTYFFVGIKLCTNANSSQSVSELCSWCFHQPCICNKEDYQPVESLMSLRAEAYCYESERNSDLFDAQFCHETTNEYQSEVHLEEVGMEQKVRPLMVSNGLCCLRKATLQPLNGVHYHVYFRVTIGSVVFSGDPVEGSNVICRLRTKVDKSDKSERCITGFRSPCIICKTSTRTKRSRPPDTVESATSPSVFTAIPTGAFSPSLISPTATSGPSAPVFPTSPHEPKRRNINEEWRSLVNGGGAPISPSGQPLSPTATSCPLEAPQKFAETWLQADMESKIMRARSGEFTFQRPRQLDALDFHFIIKKLRECGKGASVAMDTGDSGVIDTTEKPKKGYVHHVTANTISLTQFSEFHESWWASMSDAIAKNHEMWEREKIIGFIDRQTAEGYLNGEAPGTFLIRPSASGGFAVSVVASTGEVEHVKITISAMDQESGGLGSQPLEAIVLSREELSECHVYYRTGERVRF